MDLHDGQFDLDGHTAGDDGLDSAHPMIATGYEGPGSDDSLSAGLDDDLAEHNPAPDPAGDEAMTGVAAGQHVQDTPAHEEDEHGAIDITINGQQFEGRATLDSDGDGHADTALVTLNAQGDQAAISDFDGDGHAEQATLFDSEGNVIDRQHLNAAGVWVDDGAATADESAGSAAAHSSGVVGSATFHTDATGEPIRMNLHGHEYETTDTRDTDHDGSADTGILPTSDGGELVVTDTDGDGTADHARIYDSTGKDQGGIFVTSTGETAPEGAETANPQAVRAGSNDADQPGAVSWLVDPATGEWTRG